MSKIKVPMTVDNKPKVFINVRRLASAKVTRLVLELIFILGFIFITLYNIKPSTSTVKQKAENLLSLTMNFKDFNEISSNMLKIKPLVSNKLFNQYGLNDTDFSYHNFNKSKNSSTTSFVESDFCDSKDGYIIFGLMNEYVNQTRRFIMTYTYDGKVFTEVKFYEISGKM